MEAQPTLCALKARFQIEAKYPSWHIFSWPYQDAIAQVRLVFSGILERYPNLNLINHHAGATAPFFEGRITTLCNMLEMRGRAGFKRGLTKSVGEYFRMF